MEKTGGFSWTNMVKGSSRVASSLHARRMDGEREAEQLLPPPLLPLPLLLLPLVCLEKVKDVSK